MTRNEACAMAQQWVQQVGVSMGCTGAYLSGSAAKAGNIPWPQASDIDVVLLFPKGKLPEKMGKCLWNGVLLEITPLEETAVSSLEQVLSTHYLAYALSAGQILYDPHGRLSALSQQVKRLWEEPVWVEKRCQGFFQRIERDIAAFSYEASLPRQLMGFLFPAGITCFPVLTAGLENCTVRKRYGALRLLLQRHGLQEEMEGFYRLLSPTPLSPAQLKLHLQELIPVFRAASSSTGPSVALPYRGDISPAGERTGLLGIRELLESPAPMDCLFWLGVTLSRCCCILEADGAPREMWLPVLQAFCRDIGLCDTAHFAGRNLEVLRFLPRVDQVRKQVGKQG